MREFARSEHMLEKCHYCGCKNKLYTDIVDKCTGEVCGHTLRCCNCGRIVEFIDPDYAGVCGKSNIPMINYMNGKFVAGKQKCIQESYCPHKDCGLYGTCPPKRPPEKNDDNCKCNCCDSDCDFQYHNQLTVKAKNEPRFL